MKWEYSWIIANTLMKCIMQPEAGNTPQGEYDDLPLYTGQPLST